MSPDPPLRDQKRCAILDAAIALFRERGFQATSMDAIAETAGVSKRTVYNHFPSKDDLFRAVSSTLCGRVLHAPIEPYDPERPLEEQLRAMALRQIEVLSSEEFMTLARVTVAEHILRPELADGALDEIERGEGSVTRWLRAAAADGRLEVDDPVELGKQFCALIHEFAFWPQLFGTQPPPDAEARERIARSTAELVLARHAAE